MKTTIYAPEPVIGCVLTGKINFDTNGDSWEVVDGEMVYLPQTKFVECETE